MPTNPYSSALSGLSAQRTGSRKGLDLIYKAMRQNLQQFGKRLDPLDVQTAAAIAGYGKHLQTNLGGYKAQGVADVLAAAGMPVGGQATKTVDPAERALLSQLASDDVGEYQGYGGQLFKGEASYQKSLRGIDKQYVKDLLASAAREKQARQAELQQNLIDYASGLRTNSAMFGAQQQQLAFAQGQLGGGGGGGGFAGGGGGGLTPAEQWIISRESNGDPNAKNPRSSAFGLGQLTIANRNKYARALGVDPWTRDYNAQLQMFRMYYRERYGSAEAAQAFWQAHGWY